MNSIPVYLSAFMVGLMGSLHCLGMCGGIASALGVAAQPSKPSVWRQIMLQSGYHLGRIVSYGVIGVLAGLLGFLLRDALGPQVSFVLRLVPGIILIFMGLYLAGWWLGLVYIERIGMRLWRVLTPLVRRFMPVSSFFHALAIGLCWGWLPCGLVYSALVLAVSQGSWLHSGFTMVMFGLGTMPMMLATGMLSRQLTQFFRLKKTKAVAGLIVIGFGLWTLSMPLMHHYVNHAVTVHHHS